MMFGRRRGFCALLSMLLCKQMPHAHGFMVRSASKPITCKSNQDVEPAPSTLRSMTFCNLKKDQEPQMLCEFLMEIGACSTAITDADLGTATEQAIFAEPGDDPWSNDAAVVCGDQAVGTNVWNRCNVEAHFPSSTDLTEVAELVKDVLDMPLDYSVNQVPNRDWVVHVQQSWKPIVVSNFVLRFPWHTDDDVGDSVQVQRLDSMVQLKLQGGIAFGTGEHPTTQLCLSWIKQLVRSYEEEPLRLMDYGTGSGVLGLAACAMSRTVNAIGVDIDADAVRIANANAADNFLLMTSYLPPLMENIDCETKSLLMKAHNKAGDEELLPEELNGPVYDACVANILAAPLETLAPTIASLVREGGSLGLSGILSPQAESVIDAYAPYFSDLETISELEGWVLITGTRSSE